MLGVLNGPVRWTAAVLGLLLALVPAVHAEEDAMAGLGNAVCPDAELLGPKLITDIC